MKWLDLLVALAQLAGKLVPGKKRPKPGPDVPPISDDDLRRRR